MDDNYSSKQIEQKQQQQAAEARKAERLFILQVRAAMKDPNTRSFISAILAECGIFKDADSGLDTNTVFEFLGMRGVGLFIIDSMNKADPNIFINLLKENIDG